MINALNIFHGIGKTGKYILDPKCLENIKFFPPKSALCFSKESSKGLALAGKAYPPEYISLVGREFVPEVYEHFSYVKFLKKWIHKLAQPAHWDETYQFTPHILLQKLWSGGKGTGTKAVQNIVRESLNNPKTRGRVLVDACCIDGKTAPGAFYYKLGFRSTNPADNEICAKWILSGGKREDAPYIVGTMYLPRENIEQCLKYGLNSEEIARLKPELDFYRTSGLIK